jgi:hypothetical protein
MRSPEELLHGVDQLFRDYGPTPIVSTIKWWDNSECLTGNGHKETDDHLKKTSQNFPEHGKKKNHAPTACHNTAISNNDNV